MAKNTTLLCFVAVVSALVVCGEGRRTKTNNEDVLNALAAGRERWLALKEEYGLDDYEYRLFRPCTEECSQQFPNCILGDHGPFYITVKDNKVKEALIIWSSDPLDAKRFKTIEEIFDEIEELIKDGATVDKFWRFDDVQGVPDEVVIRPVGDDAYGTRIVVRMPKEFHLKRLAASKAAFEAKGYDSYCFTFKRLCPGCGPAKRMCVKNGKPEGDGMTMEDVFNLMEEAIESEPLFLDIFYDSKMLPMGMDIDISNEVVVGDTDDTFRISDLKFTKN